MNAVTETHVGKRLLRLSNLSKVLYPEGGFTKGEVLDYYRRIGPTMVPHLRERAVTFKRYPDGVSDAFFFEKNCPHHRPAWMTTLDVTEARGGGHIRYCQLNDVAGLVWAANLAAIELHTSLARRRDPDHVGILAFDLDPGEQTDIRDCCKVALRLKEVLDTLNLQAFPKTSGLKGLQVYVPLNGSATFEETKSFAHAAAMVMERQAPELVVSRISKALRRRRVLIDWNQNDRGRSMVAVYSLRAAARPFVSTPVSWDEVRAAAGSRKAGVLRYEPSDVLSRVARQGDLFAPVLRLKQRLPRLH